MRGGFNELSNSSCGNLSSMSGSVVFCARQRFRCICEELTVSESRGDEHRHVLIYCSSTATLPALTLDNRGYRHKIASSTTTFNNSSQCCSTWTVTIYEKVGMRGALIKQSLQYTTCHSIHKKPYRHSQHLSSFRRSSRCVWLAKKYFAKYIAPR